MFPDLKTGTDKWVGCVFVVSVYVLGVCLCVSVYVLLCIVYVCVSLSPSVDLTSYKGSRGR